MCDNIKSAMYHSSWRDIMFQTVLNKWSCLILMEIFKFWTYMIQQQGPHWICINIRNKVCDKITYPFPNIKCAAVGIREWTGNFIHYWAWDQIESMLLKWPPVVVVRFKDILSHFMALDLSMIRSYGRTYHLVLLLLVANLFNRNRK